MDLDAVASFLVLCEEAGHFGHAARRLHLTSPALSKRIRRLEHQVGARLIDRGPAGPSALTAAGWQFADRAAELMECAGVARDATLAAARVATTTRVRIGIPGIVGADPTMRPLVVHVHALRERIPGVIVDCLGVPYGRVLDSLFSGMVDVLWCPSRIEHPDLEAHRIGTLPRVGLVPDGHDLAAAAQVPLEDFTALPLLYNPAVPAELMSPGWLGDVRPLSDARLVRSAAQGTAQLREEILCGKGVAVLPLLPGMDIGPGLRMLDIPGLTPTVVYAVHRRPARGDWMQELVDLLRDTTRAEGERRMWPRPRRDRERLDA